RMTISGTGIPSQAAIIVRVAPDTSGTDNLAFNVLEGEISGSVTWDATLQSTSPTITVNGTGNTTPTINCGTGSCSYLTYVPLGSSFTVSASLAGFTSLTTPTQTPSASSPSLTPGALNLKVIDRSVDVTATSDGPGNFALPGATLELANADASVYDVKRTAGTDGSFTFNNVPPSTSPDTITVTFDGSTNTGSVTVGLAPAANPTIAAPVTLSAGKVAGNVSLPSGLDASSVTVYVCPSSAATSAATCDKSAALESVAPSGGKYSALVPSGAYWIGQSAATGFTVSTTEASATNVGDGTTATGPTVSYTAKPSGGGGGNGP
ncbi:MAG TPA: hypothetical protein VKV06_16775, partial [Acidimicrobiales bacterium]|nr:hypothetical protein [Acidimicrobiales bacterium]